MQGVRPALNARGGRTLTIPLGSTAMGFLDTLFNRTTDAPESTADETPTKPELEMAGAALLLEVAEADYQDDPAETEAIKAALEKEFSIEQNEVAALLERARTETDGATDLFPYTRLLNEHCTREQKLSLLTAMWRVAFADGHLDKYEEHLIRRVAELLHLDHNEFIAAKQAGRGPSSGAA